MKTKVLLTLGCILLLTLLAAKSFSPGYELEWYTIGPVSTVLTQDDFELYSAVGQGITDQVNQVDIVLCSGYLCIFGPTGSWIYLPLIVK